MSFLLIYVFILHNFFELRHFTIHGNLITNSFKLFIYSFFQAVIIILISIIFRPIIRTSSRFIIIVIIE